jgi:hypothetical protein
MKTKINHWCQMWEWKRPEARWARPVGRPRKRLWECASDTLRKCEVSQSVSHLFTSLLVIRYPFGRGEGALASRATLHYLIKYIASQDEHTWE